MPQAANGQDVLRVATVVLERGAGRWEDNTRLTKAVTFGGPRAVPILAAYRLPPTTMIVR